MNHYCDMGFWRASDQEAVARHLTDQAQTPGEPDKPRRVGLVRSALLSMLRMTGLAQQPVDTTRPVEQEETSVRESCDCGGEEFQYREAVLDDGEWVLRCPDCEHLDRLRWLSDESRDLFTGIGAAEEAGAGEADVMARGDGKDRSLVVSMGREGHL